MRLPLLAVAFSLLAGPALAAAQYTYPADGFAITLPSEPTLSKTTQKAGEATVERHDYVLDGGNGTRFVVNSTAIAGAENADEATTTKAVAENSVKALGATNATYTPIQLNGHQGMAVTCESKGKQVKYRFFLISGRLYVVSGSAPAGAPYPPAFDQAFVSFHLIP
ncbi:MAG TPA: hypothetical protein VHL34_10140 [Rhizomicrobium sp.]|jgi:hypothetical protein|nr:hypothetical protein [Rhizomicrobium sp.]